MATSYYFWGHQRMGLLREREKIALWHASDGPNHLLLLLGKIPSQQGIFLKEVTAGNQI